jgi:hypothetical protein
MNRRSEISPDYIDLEADDDPMIDDEDVYRPRPRRGIGWARRRDINDRYSQAAAPSGHGRFDFRPADRYDEELTEFAERHPAERHAGRGPRGYRRSDQRILEDVCDALTDAGDVDASQIDVNVTEGIVTLSGQVDHRRTKRRAEDIAARISGVNDVQNELRTNTVG